MSPSRIAATHLPNFPLPQATVRGNEFSPDATISVCAVGPHRGDRQDLRYPEIVSVCMYVGPCCVLTMLLFWVVTPCKLVRLKILKMETICFSESLVSIYESTRRHNPEQHRHLHRRENLRSHMLCAAWRTVPLVLSYYVLQYGQLPVLPPFCHMSISTSNPPPQFCTIHKHRPSYKFQSSIHLDS
jgi:hypothetical protein